MYLWTEELETGNTEIDRQHRELIDTINRLLEACSQGRGRTEIENTLGFLEKYITCHFTDEEALQRQSGYPDYNNHKRYHDSFRQVVSQIVAAYRAGGATIPLVAKVNSNIGDWLVSHIKREDVKVAAHLRRQKQ